MNNLTPQQMEQLKQLEKLKKVVMNKILTKKALERMGRVKLVKPELATQLELYLMQIYQSGQIKKVIDDEQLKKILNSITSKKRYNLKR
jgi:programmed cell death protein 5